MLNVHINTDISALFLSICLSRSGYSFSAHRPSSSSSVYFRLCVVCWLQLQGKSVHCSSVDAQSHCTGMPVLIEEESGVYYLLLLWEFFCVLGPSVDGCYIHSFS